MFNVHKHKKQNINFFTFHHYIYKMPHLNLNQLFLLIKLFLFSFDY
ncbi:hypothetical protein APHACPA_1053 [Rickettsia amblyommatis str. Ac/Pa]|uniref:Uncharacterized protein n=1 Tax=Rickettsia amblyommatis str. Ac/Pa TaxID=1359164 RepID=A0A0F3N205_RICAM|nr:hypothetical protein APHACPA_1053 [Rickettsia amblyommatis str. Ac/Pa]